MNTFLEDVVDTILENHKDELDQIALVIPGKRPAIFIKKYLADRLGKTFWSPDILSIQEFTSHVTNKVATDTTEILLRIYEMFSQDDFFAKETFDEFLLWAPMALSDFSEIDNYLLDGASVYQNLKNIKEIEEWSFAETPLSAEQDKFNAFWQQLGMRYQKTRSFLSENEIYDQAMIRRYLAENIEAYANTIHWKKIYFIGFNALSNAEIKTIDFLVKSGIALTCWDADAYYMKSKVQEAGFFLRKHEKREERELEKLNRIENHPKEIHFHQCSSEMVQIKMAGQLLNSLDTTKSTAILLTDENLLLPLIQSIDEQPVGVNISMGYPLTQTAFYSFCQLVFEIANFFSKNLGKGLYHKDLKRFLSHPFIQKTANKEEKKIIDKILLQVTQENLIFIEDIRSMKDMSQLAGEIEAFLIAPKNQDLTELMRSFLKLIDLAIARESIDPVTRETLFHFYNIFQSLSDVLSRYSFISTIKTLESFFIQQVNSGSLSFYGEPLKGIQITGVLESRALDFEQVIILGANEGMLPKKKTNNSFIPYELKKYFKLPTFEEQDAIYAYYFYRLLQRPSRVDLFYTTQSDVFGSTEPSRFITQVKEEIDNDAVSMVQHIHQTPMEGGIQLETEIPNTPDLQKRVLEKLQRGISPSGLNTFLRCPMDFYFKQILGLKEVSEVEEEVQNNTFGSIVHKVLEDFYNEILGQKLEVGHIEKWRKRLEKKTKEVFEEIFKTAFKEEGINWISYEVALEYLKSFFKWEEDNIKELQKDGLSIEIVGLEEWIKAEIPMEINGKSFVMKLHGMIDRVDKVGGRTRIIDYKTGSVKESDLKIASSLEKLDDGKNMKSMQLLLYKYAYSRSKNLPWLNIDSGIISLKNINNGLMKVQANGKLSEDEKENEMEANFPLVLERIVQKMLDPETHWTHDPESKFCEYCNH